MKPQYLSINIDLLPNELWLPVVGFEQYYAISNHGRVFSLRFPKLIKTPPNGKNNAGYPTVDLRVDYSHNSKKVHRMVAEAFIPNPENKPYVNHIDGNKLNPHIDNLEWVTAKENSQHAVRTGLVTGGKRVSRKLTHDDVRAIRARCVNGCKINGQSAIAKEYGVIRQVMVGIINRKTYKNVI